ncbi:MAG: hypothetical protein R3E66_05725 [bacterium]
MEYRVDHPGFRRQALTVFVNGLSSPRLLLDGAPVEGRRQVYELLDDAGQAVTVTLKPGFPDILPKVIVAGEPALALAPPLPWYAWALAALPMTLMVAGGALGGALGGLAAAATMIVFRRDVSTPTKVVVSLGSSLAASVVYFVIAFLMSLALAQA